MRQTLRDRNQHVIGYIDTEFSGRYKKGTI